MSIDFFILPFKLEFDTNIILLIVAGSVMTLTCINLINAKSLLTSIIIMSVFSLFISICYLLMDAPDVAMTETALGACLSTCVMLNLMKIFGEDSLNPKRLRQNLATILCIIFIAALTWAAIDLPEFGSSTSPLQTHLTKYYVENIQNDIAIPSMVAAILASYRGYDTLGETTVILIAGLAVMLVLSRRKNHDA